MTQTGAATTPPSTPQSIGDAGGHPPIRSFSGRRGHFTKGQRQAYEDLLAKWSLPFAPAPLDPVSVFGRRAPLVLEIGFGMGETTEAIAAARTGDDFLGVEVYPAGVGSLLMRIEQAGLGNLRVIQHDAAEVLDRMIAPDSLAGVNIFFPDPWPKARHHKRRLIRPAYATLLASRLAPGGILHCATDWEHYAQQMLEVLSAEPLLRNTCAGFAPRPACRPLTKFERRGLRLGHGVWDLLFERVARPAPSAGA